MPCYHDTPDLATCIYVTCIYAMVTSKLDYSNELYIGLLEKSTWKLQLVQNATTQLVSAAKQHMYIADTPLTAHLLPGSI